MSKFGFSTEGGGGGDFLPIVKFDARAGRLFRIDRDNVGGEWVRSEVDITKSFKAVLDLENLETGWIDFDTGGAPAFAMAKIGEPLPAKVTPKAKNGVRFMLKLAKDCGGDKPIREMAGVARAFLQGVEELYDAYEAGLKDNPGKLPVVVLDDTIPIKSSGGGQTSTNYRPVFKITSWAPRGDLEFQPKNAPAAPAAQQTGGPPSTGSTRVEAPKAKEPEMAGDDSDFG